MCRLFGESTIAVCDWYFLSTSPNTLELVQSVDIMDSSTDYDSMHDNDRWIGLIMIPGDRWTRVFLVSDHAYVIPNEF